MLTDNPDRFVNDLGAVFVLRSPEGVTETRVLSDCRHADGKSALVIKLEGLDNPESVKARSGWEICLGNAVPWTPSDENVYLFSELEGMLVRDVDTGQPVGVISGVYERPGQDILAVDYKGTEVLVPFVEPIVPVVDRKAREVHVRWKVLDPLA